MDSQLTQIIAQATSRLTKRLEYSAPALARPVAGWMRSLAGGHTLEEHLQQPLAYPLLALPWWAEYSLRNGVTPTLQADLAYASLNGFCFSRLIDTATDETEIIEKRLLSSLAFFHTEFQTVYQSYFESEHPFWEVYRKAWFGAAQASMPNTPTGRMTIGMFEHMAARKTGAALIPIAAVCHYYEQESRLEGWVDFLQRFGKWHEMYNDLFNWQKDLDEHNETFFLSEIKRLKPDSETSTEWIMRAGFTVGCNTLRVWMLDAQDLADMLNCPSLGIYLQERSDLFEKRVLDALNGFEAVVRV